MYPCSSLEFALSLCKLLPSQCPRKLLCLAARWVCGGWEDGGIGGGGVTAYLCLDWFPVTFQFHVVRLHGASSVDLPLSQFCMLDIRYFHSWIPLPVTPWEIPPCKSHFSSGMRSCVDEISSLPTLSATRHFPTYNPRMDCAFSPMWIVSILWIVLWSFTRV